MKEALWLKGLLADYEEDITNPIVIEEGIQSCIKVVEGFKLNNRTKHISIKYHFVNKNLIICKYCPTVEVLTDLRANPLPQRRICAFKIVTPAKI